MVGFLKSFTPAFVVRIGGWGLTIFRIFFCFCFLFFGAGGGIFGSRGDDGFGGFSFSDKEMKRKERGKGGKKNKPKSFHQDSFHELRKKGCFFFFPFQLTTLTTLFVSLHFPPLPSTHRNSTSAAKHQRNPPSHALCILQVQKIANQQRQEGGIFRQTNPPGGPQIILILQVQSPGLYLQNPPGLNE